MFRCLVLLALLPGCSVLFGPEDAKAIDAGMTLPFDPDADTRSVPDAGLLGQPFGSSGDYNLVDGVRADVNADGIDDLVVATAPLNGGEDGVYVLLGPQSGPDLVFHYFVQTTLAPVAITVGPGALAGNGGGLSTLLVAENEETMNRVEAFVFQNTTDGYSPGVMVSVDANTDSSAVAVGDFNKNGRPGDVVLSTGNITHQFLSWLFSGGSSLVLASPSQQEVILDLGVIQNSVVDELVLLQAKPRVTWLFYEQASSIPLGDEVRFDSGCGVFKLAKTAEQISTNTNEINVVGASDNKFCTIILYTNALGERTIRESYIGYDTAGPPSLPAPAGDYDDALILDLDMQAGPEIVLLDTFDATPSKIRLLRNANEMPANADGTTLSLTSITAVVLPTLNTPSFLLAADFNGDGIEEIWALDQRARRADCLVHDNGQLIPCQ